PASCDKFRVGVPPKAIDPCKDLANRANSGTFHWDWPGNNPHPIVFGFKLYRVDNGRHELAIGPTNRAVDGNTAILFNSVVPWACYAVSAYNLTDESPLSGQLCLGEHLEPVAPPSPALALAAVTPAVQMAAPVAPPSTAMATPPSSARIPTP